LPEQAGWRRININKAVKYRKSVQALGKSSAFGWIFDKNT
jgi:hypothetical protein